MSDSDSIIEVFHITFSFIRDYWFVFFIPFTFVLLSSFFKILKSCCLPSKQSIPKVFLSFHCDMFDNDVEISFCEKYCAFYKNGCSRFSCDSKE